MKRFSIFLLLLLSSIFLFSCKKENPAEPESGNKILSVQNESLSPGEIIQIDDYPVFVMNYKGDYGFQNYLNSGKKINTSQVSDSLFNSQRWGCTCFSAMADSCKIFGRNLDYIHHIALILFTQPSNGYSSISLADIEFLGFSEKTTLSQLKNSSDINGAPYFTMDGVNEKGVAIGIMTVPYIQPPYDPHKKNITSLDIIRLVLDYASSTVEAVQLIQNYNFKDEDHPSHYLIADKTGKSAVIEFVDNEVKVIYNNEPFQVSANFIIFGSTASQFTSDYRYNTAYSFLKARNGSIDKNTAMNILSRVYQNSTMWSSVYDMNTFSLNFSVNKKFNKVYSIKVQ